MKFVVDGVPIYFPYTHLHSEQHDYITEVIFSLRSRGTTLLEMPSGTGKTMSMLSAVVSYQIYLKGLKRKGDKRNVCPMNNNKDFHGIDNNGFDMNAKDNYNPYSKDSNVNDMNNNEIYNNANNNNNSNSKNLNLNICMYNNSKDNNDHNYKNININIMNNNDINNNAKDNNIPGSKDINVDHTRHQHFNAKDNNDPNINAKVNMGLGSGIKNVFDNNGINFHNEEPFQILYCSRTVGEVEKVLKELKLLYEYIFSDLKVSNYLGIGLTAKKNLCVNEYARSIPQNIDYICNKLIKKVEEDKDCKYYLNLENIKQTFKNEIIMDDLSLNIEHLNPAGIFTLEDITKHSLSLSICPYYYSRYLCPFSDIIVFTYNYLVNPRCSSVIRSFDPSRTVIIFDEAHNLDNVCIDSMSVDLRRKDIEDASSIINYIDKEMKCSRASSILEQERNKMKKNVLEDVDGYIMYKNKNINDVNIKDKSYKYKVNDNIKNEHSTNEKIKDEPYKHKVNDNIKNEHSTNENIKDKTYRYKVNDNIKDEHSFNENMKDKPCKYKISENMKDENTKHSFVEKSGNDFANKNRESFDTDFEFAPGNIRNGIHFVSTLKRLTEYLRTKLKTSHTTTESTSSLCQSIMDLTMVNKKTLSFLSTRLGSLSLSLNLDSKIDLSSLSKVCEFLSLAALHDKGFTIIYEPFDNEHGIFSNTNTSNIIFSPVIRLYCLDPSIAMKRIQGYRNTIITSGTLTPFNIYSKILGIVAIREKIIGVRLERNTICPLIITKGNDQMVMKIGNDENNPDAINNNTKNNIEYNLHNNNAHNQKNIISSSYFLRNNPSIIRNYGTMVYEFSKIVPDGLIIFFPSYNFMEEITTKWSETGIIGKIMKNKLIFIETKTNNETETAIQKYKKGCENGRGSILFAIARGKVSEGIDFKGCHGRCVIIIGMPFLYNQSIRLKKRLEYMENNLNIKQKDFLRCEAMTQVSQCLGRVIRGRNDYGLMVMADCRFIKGGNIGVPGWIGEWIKESNTSLSVDMAVAIGKRFYREMAQGFTN